MSQQENYITDILLENPKWAEILFLYMKNIQHHKFGTMQDIVYQRDRYRSLEENLSDAYQDLWFLHRKDIYLKGINFGKSPYPDKEKLLNNEALEKLPYPFEAHFKGGCGDDDGIFKWKEPIYLINYYEMNKNKKLKKLLLEPGSCSLEVGYTKAVTTKIHLSRSRFLARWPYEHPRIWLIYWDNHKK